MLTGGHLVVLFRVRLFGRVSFWPPQLVWSSAELTSGEISLVFGHAMEVPMSRRLQSGVPPLLLWVLNIPHGSEREKCSELRDLHCITRFHIRPLYVWYHFYEQHHHNKINIFLVLILYETRLCTNMHKMINLIHTLTISPQFVIHVNNKFITDMMFFSSYLN